MESSDKFNRGVNMLATLGRKVVREFINERKATWSALLREFGRVRLGPPKDLDRYVRERPAPDCLPSPWETWTLITLVDYCEKRLLGVPLMHELMSDPQSLIARPTARTVLGQSEWLFSFEAAEGVDYVTFIRHDGEDRVQLRLGDVRDAFVFEVNDFFHSFRGNHKADSDSPETRLRELHPSRLSLMPAIHELQFVEAIPCYLPIAIYDPHNGEECEYNTFSPEILRHRAAIMEFCRNWRNPSNRLWLSAMVGDWPAAATAAEKMRRIRSFAQERANECRERRLKRFESNLQRMGQLGGNIYEPLAILADLGCTRLDRYVRQAFRRGDSCSEDAFYFVEESDYSAACPDVLRWVQSGDPNAYSAERASAFLKRHGYCVGRRRQAKGVRVGVVRRG